MTRKNESNQSSKYAKSELIQMGDKFMNFAQRDMGDLKTLGFKKELISLTKNAREAYNEFPTDEEVLANQTAVTEQKSTAAEKLKTAIKEVIKRISLHYGDDSPEMKKAGGKAISDLNDAKLCEKGRRVERTGREYLEALKENGVTTEMLDHLKSANDTFDDLIDVQKDLIVQREIKTQERRKLANELYEAIVKISEFGKATYDGIDISKYNSYKINDKPKKRKGNGEVEDENKTEE